MLVEQGAVQLQLAREVLVEHGLADARALGDVVHRRRVVAVGDEQLVRCPEQLLAPGGTVRIAALARDGETVDVAIRAEDTGFSADHFRARLRFPRPQIPGDVVDGSPVLPLVPVDPVTELYGSAGLDFDRDIIAYCRIGERSAHTWFVLHELLGKENVKNYDGSWTEYGSLVGVPVAVGDEPGQA